MSKVKTTIAKMNELRLQGMRRAFESSLETKQVNNLTPDDLISYLVQAEWEYRENKRLQTGLKKARFRYAASVEEISYDTTRNINKNTLMRLADCTFIDKGENIIITGATGVGKSYIASAFGHQACLKGYKVAYYNTSKLFTKLKMTKGDGTYTKELIRLAKQDVLILDDFGLHPIDEQIKLSLLEIIEDRHGKRSTIIATQIPVNKWHDLIDEKTIADAILDRIVHASHRIEIKGESLRKKQSIKQ
jgi:DNA replication protein DnaC